MQRALLLHQLLAMSLPGLLALLSEALNLSVSLLNAPVLLLLLSSLLRKELLEADDLCRCSYLLSSFGRGGGRGVCTVLRVWILDAMLQ